MNNDITTPITNSDSSSSDGDSRHSNSTSQPIADSHSLPVTRSDTDVLIIGAGLAGISVALSLPKHLQITLISKDSLPNCASYHAQGGIAACLGSNDSVAQHVQDTLLAGDGLCDATATEHILSKAAAAVDWLCQMGVPFSTKPTTNIQPSTDTRHAATGHAQHPISCQLSDLHLTQEGGHGQRRIAHAADATGKHIMDTLLDQLQQHDNINLLCHQQVQQLLTVSQPNPSWVQPNLADLTNATLPYCVGAVLIDSHQDNHQNHHHGDNNHHSTHSRHNAHTNHSTHTSHSNRPAQHHLHAKAVVLATGGLGQLFARSSAPSVCLGDGMMLAWQAGCRLANLEFVQFHPTGLAVADSSFLISEALRGEGALLKCPVTGHRFMPDYDQRAELAPRDVVARAISHEIQHNGAGHVHLDISHLPAATVCQHFPSIYQHCLSHGIDITERPIPVAPTAHYSCGGVVTSTEGLTDVRGLYAVGEVACTGLHGANRLASNSLLECVVVGRSIAKHLPDYIERHSSQPQSCQIHNSHRHMFSSDFLSDEAVWQTPPLHNGLTVTTPLDANSFVYKQSLYKKSLYKKSVDKQPADAQSADETGGKEQSAADQNTALAQASSPLPNLASSPSLSNLKQLMTQCMGIIRDETHLRTALTQLNQWQQADSDPQWQRLCQLCELMLLSALSRMESRGGHYRQDCPDKLLAARPSVVAASTAASCHRLSATGVQTGDHTSNYASNHCRHHGCTDTPKRQPAVV